MPRNELVVLLQGERAAVLTQEQATLRLIYDADWRIRDEGYPLSQSLPLSRREHEDVVVRAYLEGLLPDNDDILQRWARRFGVSARNPFSLLQHVGEDVAGAAQFVHPDRVAEIRADTGSVDWLADQEVADLLALLVREPGASRPPQARGQFSLAGAQPKTALLFRDGRWGIPSGATPTTHILKPPTLDLDHLAENEHLCLGLAQEVGISAANSTLMRFEDRVAIVVERYDRVEVGGRLLRLHQEDLCQSDGVGPRTKYESEGGPGIGRITELLRTHSTEAAEDVERFVSAIAFNWAIGGSDAHAKNYSVLIGPHQVRLAPLYDLISALPYASYAPPERINLAMKIGGESRIGRVRTRHWHRLAEQVELEPGDVSGIAAGVISAILDSIQGACTTALDQGLDAEFVERYAESVQANALRCARALGAGA